MTPEKRACETYSRVVAANPQTRAADVALWAEAIAAAERAAYLRGAEEMRGRCGEKAETYQQWCDNDSVAVIRRSRSAGEDIPGEIAAALRALPPEPPAGVDE